MDRLWSCLYGGAGASTSKDDDETILSAGRMSAKPRNDFCGKVTSFIISRKALSDLELGYVMYVSLKDHDGIERYKLVGKRNCRSSTIRILSDAKGREIYKVKPGKTSLSSKRYVLNAESGAKLLTLEKQNIVPPGESDSATRLLGVDVVSVWKNDGVHGKPWLTIKGEPGSFMIVDDENRILLSLRYWGSNDAASTLPSSYLVRISRSANMALMLALLSAVVQRHFAWHEHYGFAAMVIPM